MTRKVLIVLGLMLLVECLSAAGASVSLSPVRTLFGPSTIVSVAFSPDSRLLAFASTNYDSDAKLGDHTVTLCDVATGDVVWKIFPSPLSPIYSLAFHPDGKFLAGGCMDHTVKLWDVATGQWVRTLSDHGGEVWSVAFSPDGKFLASGSLDRTVRLWDGGAVEKLHHPSC